MKCETTKALLSEFHDEILGVATAWQVQTHLADCAACTKLSREMLALRRALRGLPARQPSAQFDSNLAQRLALTRRPQKSRGWDRFGGLFQVPRLRPVLALGFALTAIATAVWIPQQRVTPHDTQVARTADKAFVADCVAQHRKESTAEPLADLAAQNLAGHLDSTANSDDSTPAASDSGLF